MTVRIAYEHHSFIHGIATSFRTNDYYFDTIFQLLHCSGAKQFSFDNTQKEEYD